MGRKAGLFMCRSPLIRTPRNLCKTILFTNLMLSRTYIWCEHFYRLLSSRCDMEKGGGKGKGYWIDNRMRLAAVQPGATWTLMVCAARGGLTRVPPPPQDYGQILAVFPKVEDGLHFGDCEYDI